MSFSGWLKGQNLWVRIGKDDSRVIFVIRRLLGTAVKRNRLKRRLRAICREFEPTPWCLVVLPLPPATEISFQALRDELVDLFNKLKEYRGQ